MDVSVILFLVLGLAALVAGGELLVRGASALAALLGLSPLVIGLTVVAFGTSAPELAVSVQAGLAGNGDIAVGNVVGSNIFNVLFILGAAALIAPLVVGAQIVRREVPIMIGVSVLLMLLTLDGTIGLLDGILLFALLIVYTAWSVISSRRETAAIKAEYAQEYGEAKLSPQRGPLVIARDLALIAGGLALLIVGSDWLVGSAVSIAASLGVSSVIIGLTIVAAGTSLPEVVTSIVATLKNERDIAIGNVVGSNIFNIAGILGLSSMISPGGLAVPQAIVTFDMPVMIAVAVATLPIFWTGMTIRRWEGVLFLGYYVAYTTYLVLGAVQHDALPFFSSTMAWFVLPLTAVTLAVIVLQSLRNGKRPQTTA
jgi:cation:H+ antiporter